MIGIGVGHAFDYVLEQYKKEHCTCRDIPAGAAGNSAAGGAVGGSGPLETILGQTTNANRIKLQQRTVRQQRVALALSVTVTEIDEQADPCYRAFK